MSALLEFNDLLEKSGIGSAGVLVMRHRPAENDLRRRFGWLAAERADLFDAFQSSHGPQVEAMMTKARLLASFIGHAPGRALFIGLHEVRGSRSLSHTQFWAMPAHRELQSLGMRGFRGERPAIRYFDLAALELAREWKGRLVCDWHAERSWARWASRNAFPIRALHEESLLVERMPRASELVLSWAELHSLPMRWRAAMSQWRGVYYLFDRRRNLGYVGSASGNDNLLGRWLDYAASGHGGNKWLKASHAADLHFSVLELLAPETSVDEVVAVENRWKARLSSRHPHGLNDN